MRARHFLKWFAPVVLAMAMPAAVAANDDSLEFTPNCTALRLNALMTCLKFSGSAEDVDALPLIDRLPERTLCGAPSVLGEGDQTCQELMQMGESRPLLYRAGHVRQAFCLVWQRSFNFRVVVRVEINSSKAATMTVTEGRFGPEPGGGVIPAGFHFVRRGWTSTVRLLPDEIAAIETGVGSLDFWTLPHHFVTDVDLGSFRDPGWEPQVVVTDGATWYVEGIEADRYQIMADQMFNSPPSRFGLLLLNIARRRLPTFDIQPIY